MLTAKTSKRLQTTQAQLQEISYAPVIQEFWRLLLDTVKQVDQMIEVFISLYFYRSWICWEFLKICVLIRQLEILQG